MFITYTHPSQLRDRNKRRQVASYSAKPYKEIALSSRTYEWRRNELQHFNKRQTSGSDVVPVNSISTVEGGEEGAEWPFLLSEPIRGLRVDPFNSYPIEAKGHVPWALDSWVQVVAPATIIEAGRGQDGSNPLLKRLFSLGLQSDILCEAFVVVSLSFHSAPLELPEPRACAIRYHRSRTISKLLSRLADPQVCSDDITILTVLNLMGADFCRGDFMYVEAHRSGLGELVKLRGGLDSLGQDGFLKYLVLGIEMGCDIAMKRCGPSYQRAPPTSPDTVLQYPSHPFEPDVRTVLSGIPEGFRELAHAGQLSLQMITLLRNFQEHIGFGTATDTQSDEGTVALRRVVNDMNTHNTTVGVSDLEQCLLSGLLSYLDLLYYVSKRRRTLSERYRSLVQLDADAVLAFCDAAGEDYVIWLSMVLEGTRSAQMTDASHHEAHLRKVMQLHPAARRWDMLSRILNKFYCDDIVMKLWQGVWWQARRGLGDEYDGYYMRFPEYR